MQDCGGGTAATFVGMLITSAVAMFFSCSGATGFSEIEIRLRELRLVFECRSRPLFLDPSSLFRLTDEAREGYVSSSFLGTELSILTLLPERSVRKIL